MIYIVMRITIAQLRQIIREALSQDTIVPGRWGGDGPVDPQDLENAWGLPLGEDEEDEP